MKNYEGNTLYTYNALATPTMNHYDNKLHTHMYKEGLNYYILMTNEGK